MVGALPERVFDFYAWPTEAVKLDLSDGAADQRFGILRGEKLNLRRGRKSPPGRGLQAPPGGT